MSRIRLTFPLIALVLFLLVSPALAGGWSVTTLDRLPEQIVENEAVTIGFVVRQHGVHVVSDLTPTISAAHQRTGDTLEVLAVEDSPGHYSADLIFPSPGTWDWSVSAFGPEQPLPALTVLARKTVWGSEGDPKTSISAEQALAERGSALYIAKGCVVCHQHDGVDVAAWASINRGPDLSDFGAPADSLSAWLQNPSAIDPDTVMPNLRLQADEIEALVAFLNAEGRDAARTEHAIRTLRSLMTDWEALQLSTR